MNISVPSVYISSVNVNKRAIQNRLQIPTHYQVSLSKDSFGSICLDFIAVWASFFPHHDVLSCHAISIGPVAHLFTLSVDL